MKIKPVLIVKIAIDLCMTVLLLLLISYHLLPDAAHEWLGASVFVLFLVHNGLNLRWYRNLFKGKYTAVRIMQTTVNFLLWIAMLGCIISALIISGHVFAFLNLSSARFGRALHLSATVWAFILMSFHLGLHMQMFIGMAKKIAKPSDKAAIILKWIFRIVSLAVGAFGVYVFITRSMWEELFLLTEFKWFDYEKSLLVYILENASMLMLFALVGYYFKKLVSTIRKSPAYKEKR